MSNSEPKISWIGGLVALLLGFVFLVGISELVVRVVYPSWNEFYAGRFMTIEHVDGYGDVTTGRKGFDGHFSQNNGDFRSHIRINDFGLRNDAPVNEADNRTWIIGDSMAFGWGVNGNEMYSSVIGDISGRLTYNIASPGTNVCGYQALAGRMPDTVKPHAVIIGLILENDLHDYDCTEYAKEKRDVITTGGIFANYKTVLTEHSALYNFFAVSLKRVDVVREALIWAGFIQKSHAYRNQIAGMDLNRIIDRTAAELARLRDMFEPMTPFVVLVAPARYEIAEDDTDFKIIRIAMENALQEYGLPFVDPFDEFKTAGFEETHFIHDGHWSAAGHRIAAEAVAKWLDDNAP
ncbi:MAG: GDSL-type esterase/lipase family protein [Rhodospirillales bacterium]